MKFHELSDEAKEHALEKEREYIADDGWYDFIIEDAKSTARLLGWNVEHVYFSGFWSQGDGACFTGTWAASDVKIGELVQHAPQDETLHGIAKEFEEVAARYQTVVALGGEVDPEPHMRITHAGRGSHEYSVHIDGDAPLEEDFKRVVDASRDLMRWIYRRLEEEYDYLTSDEQVQESIEASDYDFDEEGGRV